MNLRNQYFPSQLHCEDADKLDKTNAKKVFTNLQNVVGDNNEPIGLHGIRRDTNLILAHNEGTPTNEVDLTLLESDEKLEKLTPVKDLFSDTTLLV